VAVSSNCDEDGSRVQRFAASFNMFSTTWDALANLHIRLALSEDLALEN
jgi:hypothetical protein